MAKKRLHTLGETKTKLATLKKAGLVNIDLRKVTEKSLDNKSFRDKLNRQIKKFVGFLSGDEALVEVKDRSARKALVSRGYKTAGRDKALIPVRKGQSVISDKSGNLTYTANKVGKGGKKVIELSHEPNINMDNVNTIEDAIAKYSDLYEIESGTRIGFTYYGNNSKKVFGSIREALEEIMEYEETQNKISTSSDPANFMDLIKAVQLTEYISGENPGRANVLIKERKAKASDFYKTLTPVQPAKRGKKK